MDRTQDKPSDNLVATGQTVFGLQGKGAGASDEHGEDDEPDLGSHQSPSEVIRRVVGPDDAREVGQDRGFENEIENADEGHQSAAQEAGQPSVRLFVCGPTRG